MQQCTLSFKSFKDIHIKNSCRQIRQAIKVWNIPVHSCSFTDGPTLRKRFTILRSPHIHKKSREQFEWVRKKGQLSLFFPHQRHVLLVLFWLQSSQLPGVQLTITLNHSSVLPKTYLPLGCNPRYK